VEAARSGAPGTNNFITLLLNSGKILQTNLFVTTRHDTRWNCHDGRYFLRQWHVSIAMTSLPVINVHLGGDRRLITAQSMRYNFVARSRWITGTRSSAVICIPPTASCCILWETTHVDYSSLLLLWILYELVFFDVCSRRNEPLVMTACSEQCYIHDGPALARARWASRREYTCTSDAWCRCRGDWVTFLVTQCDVPATSRWPVANRNFRSAY